MKLDSSSWWPHPMAKTIWARGSSDLIPERFRRIITVVMPIIYTLILLFGLLGASFPVPTLTRFIGVYGMLWSFFVFATAAQSLIGLAYKLRIEIYSSIVLSVLLCVYPVFLGVLIFTSHHHVSLAVLAVFPFTAIVPVMPAWRVFDIIKEIRKSRKRQLYAEAKNAEADHEGG